VAFSRSENKYAFNVVIEGINNIVQIAVVSLKP
jgi:hypothetical protein